MKDKKFKVGDLVTLKNPAAFKLRPENEHLAEVTSCTSEWGSLYVHWISGGYGSEDLSYDSSDFKLVTRNRRKLRLTRLSFDLYPNV